MARGGYGVVVVVVVVLAAGCGQAPATDQAAPDPAAVTPVADDTDSGEPAAWHLVGSSPDGRLLDLVTFGGCTDFVGWTTTEDADTVTVEARWEPDDGGACRAILLTESLRLELDAPLGDRELVGCQRPDCTATDDADALAGIGGPGTVLADATTVVVDDGLRRWAVASDGTPVWDGAGGGWPELSDGVLVEHDFDRTITALDVTTGETAWQLDGSTRGPVVGDLVVVCPPEQAGDPPPFERFVGAVSLADGTERWRVEDEGCFSDSYATDGDVIAAVDLGPGGGDGEDAGVMVLRDVVDGTVRHEVPLGSGATPTGPTAFDGGFAVAELDGDLYVVDADTGELGRHPDAGGSIVTAVGGVLLVQRGEEVVAVDASDGSDLWRHPQPWDRLPPWAAADDALFRGDGPAGELHRVDPVDGSTIWTAEVGRSPGVAVAEHDGVVYAATSTALTAVDAATGEHRWWTPLAEG